MMFSLFLVKKVLKNKFNFIPVLLLLLLIPVTLYMNQKTENETGLASWTKEKIEFRTDEIKKLKKHLTTLNEEDEAYIGTKGIIDIYEKQLELDIQALDAINSANWKVANKNLALVAYQDYELSKNSPTMSVQDLNASLGEAMVFDKLAELNLEYQSTQRPLKGINFLFGMLSSSLPFAFVLALIFVLTNLFSSFYYQNLNIMSIYPKSKKTSLFKILFSSTSLSIAFLTLTLGYVFLLSSLFFGSGSVFYPTISFDLKTRMLFIQPIFNTFLPVAVLMFLSIIFINLLVYLLCFLLRDKLSSLFLSLFLTIGILSITLVWEELQKIAYLLPTTYFLSFPIATGIFQSMTNQFDPSFASGVFVLSVAILLLIIFIKGADFIKSEA